MMQKWGCRPLARRHEEVVHVTASGVALVGAGHWGPDLVRSIKAGRALRLRWLCDPDEEPAVRVLAPYSTVQTTSSLQGAGSVATADVPPHAFVAGNPAKQRGWACECGPRLDRNVLCNCGRSAKQLDNVLAVPPRGRASARCGTPTDRR
jgi:hypothetical protein